jgi:hypothetical protein
VSIVFGDFEDFSEGAISKKPGFCTEFVRNGRVFR